MFSEEDITEQLHDLCSDWDNPPVQVDLSDKICTVRVEHPDDAYDILCDMENPNFYSLDRVNDGRDIWYKFRYEKG